MNLKIPEHDQKTFDIVDDLVTFFKTHGLPDYHMPSFYINDKKKFIWARIPKNANTSIKIAIDYELCYTDLNPDIEWFENLTQKKLDEYFKFTIVRNPWDKHVSLYRWFHNNQNRNIYDIPKSLTFKDFVKKRKKDYTTRLKVHCYPQHLYFNWTKFDFIGRFETLATDWKKLMDRFGFPKLTVTNKSNGGYKKYYDIETKNIIAEEYKNDIKLLNYKF